MLQKGNDYFHERKKQSPHVLIPQPRKYLLQPIPKSNPYEKQELLNPYSLFENFSSPQPSNDVPNCSHPLLQDPTTKLFCENCKKQVTHQVFSICDKKEMCIGCMANLETFPEDYEIVQKLDYPLFESTWTVYQEVLLLSSLEKYAVLYGRWGFGNWKDIQEYMEYFGAKFTQDQIETHYNTFYLADKTFIPIFSQSLIDRKKQAHSISKIFTPNQVSVASLTTNAREDSMNFIFQEIDDFSHDVQIQQVTAPTPPHSQIKGYNPFRKQFEVDYDETAEKNIANLEFRDDDLPEERQVKFKMLEEYNMRLNKRYGVQDFIVEHRLMDVDYQKEVQENRSEYEKQAASQMKKFMRFSSLDVHAELVRRVALQKELKSIIEGMRSFRRISNTGRLKQTMQNLRRQSIVQQTSAPVIRSRGRPRKIIHVDNSQKSTTSNSQSLMPVIKKHRHEEELLKRLNISMTDLKFIIKESGQKADGDAFKYKGVEVLVVEKN